MSGEIRSDRRPRGPVTETVPAAISTETPSGTGMGMRPILLTAHHT